MKKLIIILSLFISYSSYAQYVPKAGNKLNVKPNGILVPISTTDDTPIARAEIFDTGLSVLKASTLPIASDSVLGGIKVGSGLSINSTTGVLSATGGGGTSYTAGNGLSLTGTVFSADTSIVATNANTLSLAETFARFGSGNFFTNSTYFVNGGTNNTTDVFSLNPTFIASKQDLLVSGTNIKTLGGVSLLGSGDFGILPGTYGGTGINNGARTITIAGNFTTTGAFTTSIAVTANTSIQLPTTGTLYGTATGSVSSAQLLATLSNETGLGNAVFGTSPTITTPNLTYAIANKTAAYTVTLTDYTLTGDATTASFTMTLPTAASSTGKIYSFKKIDATANTVTVKGNGAELIDGVNTKVITTQYSGFTVQSNGTVWYIIM